MKLTVGKNDAMQACKATFDRAGISSVSREIAYNHNVKYL